MRTLLIGMLSSGMTYGNHLTMSGRVLLGRLCVAGAAAMLAIVAITLLQPATWRDVAAGLVLGWSVSILVWALASYRNRTAQARVELRQMAELDFLHARLNHLAGACGLPTVSLNNDIEVIIAARMERLAHFTALDEYRLDLVTDGGYAFWDEEALGIRTDQGA